MRLFSGFVRSTVMLLATTAMAAVVVASVPSFGHLQCQPAQNAICDTYTPNEFPDGWRCKPLPGENNKVECAPIPGAPGAKRCECEMFTKENGDVACACFGYVSL